MEIGNIVANAVDVINSPIVDMQIDTLAGRKSMNIVESEINGAKFSKYFEMLYDMYTPGDITIAMDLFRKWM